MQNQMVLLHFVTYQITLFCDCFHHGILTEDSMLTFKLCLVCVWLAVVFGSRIWGPCDGCGCASSHCKSPRTKLTILVWLSWLWLLCGPPCHKQCPQDKTCTHTNFVLHNCHYFCHSHSTLVSSQHLVKEYSLVGGEMQRKKAFI